MSTETQATINLDEVYPAKLNDDAKEALTRVNQKLAELRKAKQVELHDLAAASAASKTKIEAQGLTVKSLKDVIELKKRGQIATSHDQALLQDAEEILQSLTHQQAELARNRTIAEEKFGQKIAKVQEQVEAAQAEVKRVAELVSMATNAADAYKSNPRHGVGPIPRYTSVKDALRVICKVGFILDASGAPFRVATRLEKSFKLTAGTPVTILPDKLSWLSSFKEYSGLPHGSRPYCLLASGLATLEELLSALGEKPDAAGVYAEPPYIYIDELSKVLATSPKATVAFPSAKAAPRQPDEFLDYSKLIPSYLDVLEHDLQLPLIDDAYCLGSSGPTHPILGQLIDETWGKASSSIPNLPVFASGQRRMAMAEIDGLIGRYWDAFLASPWESTMDGAYALLKHRCTRGETANVYSFDTTGHFGFRMRTPDHDWILGEIYCPPHSLGPKDPIDPGITQSRPGLVNGRWLAEVGPAKIAILAQRWKS